MTKHNLTISLTRGMRLDGVPIALKVIGDDLETKWEGAVDIGGSKTIPIEAGQYSIQADLPSGKRKTAFCDLSEKSGEVVMDLVGYSPQESLEWAVLNNTIQPGDVDLNDEHFREVWLRLWYRAPNAQWQILPWSTPPPDQEPGLVQFKFDLKSRPGQYYLQAGAPNMQWRLFALPADDIRVLIKSNKTDLATDEAASIVDVIISSENSAINVLLGYLQTGQVDQAQIIDAERLLQEKLENPMAAAVAGYYLLGLEHLDRVHQVWTDNLARWIGWLPDGAIINAWYHLRSPQPNINEIKGLLLDAASRGVPIYTHGLRLLLDGLSMIDDAEDIKSDTSAAVRSALKLVRTYAAATDWRSLITSFVGRDPDSPGKEMTGRPEDEFPVVFISDLSVNKFSWIGSKKAVKQKASRKRRLNSALKLRLDASAQKGMEFVSDSGEIRLELSKRSSFAKSLQQIRDANSPERIMARVFNLRNSQSEGDSLTDIEPIELVDGTKVHGTAFERILGTSNLVSTSFFECGAAAARTVGRVVVRTSENASPLAYATGFLVSPRLFITASHVIVNARDAEFTTVEFDYQDRPDGQLRERTIFRLDPTRFFISNKELDISLIAVGSKVSGPAELSDLGWGHLSGDTGKALIGEQLSSILHLDARPKQIAIRALRLTGIVDDFLYCQSDLGSMSSGSPVFNDQWEIVGICRASRPEPDQQTFHEVIRSTRIVQYLKEIELEKSQQEFRDEMLFIKPPMLLNYK